MISLEEYKKYIINFYIEENDNNELNKYTRKMELSRKYNDKLLQKIIDDTYDFIKDIFKSKTIEDGYCRFELDEDTTSYINLNLDGNLSSDKLYTIMNERIVSVYILKKIFGDNFRISIEEDEIPFITNNEYIMSCDYRYSLYLRNFPENINDIKHSLFGKSRKLTKKR